jgi:hypothetical protein
MCPILKKLTNKLRPYREVNRLVDEILKSKKGNDIRVLEHLLSFAEDQFGKEITGKHYRERGDGDRKSDWIVEIEILNDIIMTLAYFHGQNTSLGTVIRDDMSFPYLERSLKLLNPWVIKLDIDASEGNDGLSEKEKNRILEILNWVEQNMAVIAMQRIQFDLAEGHCHRGLAYSRRYGLEGENKTTMIFTALRSYYDLRHR